MVCPLADGQGMIAVGQGGQVIRHKPVPGHLAHGRQHPGVGNIPRLKLPGHHGAAGLGIIPERLAGSGSRGRRQQPQQKPGDQG